MGFHIMCWGVGGTEGGRGGERDSYLGHKCSKLWAMGGEHPKALHNKYVVQKKDGAMCKCDSPRNPVGTTVEANLCSGYPCPHVWTFRHNQATMAKFM